MESQINPGWAGHPDGFLQVNPGWDGHPDGFLQVNHGWAGHPDRFLQVKKIVLVICLAVARSLLRPGKKSSRHLSGRCAIVITTRKKKKF